MAVAHQANAGGTGSFASVNGLDIYYETHGAGAPLILIPGGLMTIAMMGEIVPSLAKTRQVIAVEPQAHGHTSDIDRPLTYEQMADDTASLIEHLGFARADVFGFSVGGGIALQTAIRHPDAVRKLVAVSAPYGHDGVYPEIHAFEASFDPASVMLSANQDAYLRAAPTSEGWPVLVEKMRLLLTEAFDWTEDVTAIQSPALIVIGDADTVRVPHAVALFELLGGGTAGSAMGRLANAQLAVIPGTTEFGLLSRVHLLLAIITPFLDAPMPEAT